jgi:hypothetical protein
MKISRGHCLRSKSEGLIAFQRDGTTFTVKLVKLVKFGLNELLRASLANFKELRIRGLPSCGVENLKLGVE